MSRAQRNTKRSGVARCRTGTPVIGQFSNRGPASAVHRCALHRVLDTSYGSAFAVAFSISAKSPLSRSIGFGGQPAMTRSTGTTCATEPTVA